VPTQRSSSEAEDTVVYSTKEMFERVDRKLDAIVDSLSTKATREDIAEMKNAINDLDRRVERLEDGREADKIRQEGRQVFLKRLWITVTSIVVPVGVALIYIYH